MFAKAKSLYGGLFLIALISFTSLYLAELPVLAHLGISSLVVAIVLGIVYGNTVHHRTPSEWFAGISFSQKRLLRIGIILYGFRITFQQIAEVGLGALLVDVIVVCVVLVAGYWMGVKVFKLDKKLSMLISCGSGICGAAAVLGAEPTIKARPHETSIAVATVVIYGTISMFLSPHIAQWLGLSGDRLGVALGATVHEVAQVVGAGAAISEEVTGVAVIVKLTRVMLLIPVLVILGAIFAGGDDGREKGGRIATLLKSFPWFALGFVLASGFNSLNLLGADVVEWIRVFDNFVLTMAMAALGVETNMGKVRQVGAKPFVMAAVIYVMLTVMMLLPFALVKL